MFVKNIEELKEGKDFSELSNEYVPRTADDVAKVEARKQLSKEKLFIKLKTILAEGLTEFTNDDFLMSLKPKVEGKTHNKFSKKKELVDLVLSLEQHLENLKIEKEFEWFNVN